MSRSYPCRFSLKRGLVRCLSREPKTYSLYYKIWVSASFPIGPVLCPWILGFKLLAFTITSSRCGSILLISSLPHSALLGCSVYALVSLRANPVRLMSFVLTSFSYFPVGKILPAVSRRTFRDGHLLHLTLDGPVKDGPDPTGLSSAAREQSLVSALTLANPGIILVV